MHECNLRTSGLPFGQIPLEGNSSTAAAGDVADEEQQQIGAMDDDLKIGLSGEPGLGGNRPGEYCWIGWT